MHSVFGRKGGADFVWIEKDQTPNACKRQSTRSLLVTHPPDGWSKTFVEQHFKEAVRIYQLLYLDHK